MTDYKELVERLLRMNRGALHYGQFPKHINPDGPAAADALESLAAENAALREAGTALIADVKARHPFCSSSTARPCCSCWRS